MNIHIRLLCIAVTISCNWIYLAKSEVIAKTNVYQTKNVENR